MPIRVLIADDHVILREGVALILNGREEFEVVGQATNGATAVDLAKQLKPDVALLDISMPEMTGIEVTRRLARDLGTVRTLILTMHDDDELFFEAIRAGASGYVLKGSRPSELFNAITAVHKGDIYLSPPMTRKLVNRLLNFGDSEESEKLMLLTDREKEVMYLLAKGLTNREIGEQLTISPSTVQTHRTHIMQKLELNNRAELIRYAMRHNLIIH